ncbi:class I SAM-dependent methyltransferase [Phytomonospora sp. NPDC050363]|uniref:class I SAM-dependent methyltransferase n=1 Tax=Phytomonospora sp. NPDC050363 TaxID=3155642 RepID=UPI00340329AD
MTTAFTDRTALSTAAYVDERPLETRRAIYDYRRPRLDLVGEVVHRLRDIPAGVVADVGCGSGAYTKALRAARADLDVLAVDLSSGMVGVAGQPGFVADAMTLPLADDSCSAVLALHMLYHVPDPAAAVAEYGRVLRADGSCLIIGNGPGDKVEFNEVWSRATREVTGRDEVGIFGPHILHFGGMEKLAGEVFPTVERIEYFGRTVVPDPGPVIAFIDSTRHLNSAPAFDAVRDRAAEIVTDIVAREGAFTFSNHLGMIRAMPC